MGVILEFSLHCIINSKLNLFGMFGAALQMFFLRLQ